MAKAVANLTNAPSTQPAYNYTINPFHCDMPSVTMTLNASYFALKLVYYNEAPQDGFGLYPMNRTTFTFATFKQSIANQALVWDPSNPSNLYNPSMANAYSVNGPFGSLALLGASGDPNLYAGLCNPAYPSGTFAYTNNLTVPLENQVTLAAGQYTPTFMGYTAQTLGCQCAAFSMDASNVIYPIADKFTSGSQYLCQGPVSAAGTADSADNNRIYWTSNINTTNFAGVSVWNSTYNTRGWAVRQTTCQSGSGLCVASGNTWQFLVNTSGYTANTCGLRTEALFVEPVPMLQNLPGTVVYNATTGLSTFTLYTVEVGSTSNGTSNVVDSFSTRVIPHPFQVQQNKYGSIVIPIDAGDVLPPVISRLVDTYTYRDTANPNLGYAQLMMSLFVRQPTTLQPGVNVNSAFSSVNGYAITNTTLPLIQLSNIDMSGIAVQTTTPGGQYTLSCPNMANVTTPQTTGTTFACHYPNCGLMQQAQLPTYVTQTFNPSVLSASANLYWIQYDVTILCNITATSQTFTSTFQVPSTQFTLPYVLAQEPLSGPYFNYITDLQNKPTITWSGSFQLPGITQTQISFPLTSQVLQLSESTVQNDLTLTDVINDNLNSGNVVNSQHAFAYSEALAFDVQLNNTADQAQWQLRPALVLMTAFSNSAVASPTNTASQYQAFSASSQLDVNWCGLNSTSLVAAFVFQNQNNDQDSMAAPTIAGNSITSLGVYGNMQNGLTTALNQQLATLVTSNTYANVSLFQGDIYNSTTNSTGQYRVFTVADQTGGFAVPMRNRLLVNGQAGTYAINFCALTEVIQYNPEVRGGWYPVYPTANAAKADSLPINGTIQAPVQLFGSDMASNSTLTSASATSSIKYYLPLKPASNPAGIVCVPPGMVGLAKLANVSGVTANTNAACVSLINAVTGVYAGRRRLQGAPRALMAVTQGVVSSSDALAAGASASNTQTQYAAQPITVQFQGYSAPVATFSNPPPAPPSPPPPSPSPPPPPTPPPSPSPPAPTPVQAWAAQNLPITTKPNGGEIANWVLFTVIVAFMIGAFVYSLWRNRKSNTSSATVGGYAVFGKRRGGY